VCSWWGVRWPRRVWGLVVACCGGPGWAGCEPGVCAEKVYVDVEVAEKSQMGKDWAREWRLVVRGVLAVGARSDTGLETGLPACKVWLQGSTFVLLHRDAHASRLERVLACMP
jgi:hypothetical protein